MAIERRLTSAVVVRTRSRAVWCRTIGPAARIWSETGEAWIPMLKHEDDEAGRAAPCAVAPMGVPRKADTPFTAPLPI